MGRKDIKVIIDEKIAKCKEKGCSEKYIKLLGDLKKGIEKKGDTPKEEQKKEEKEEKKEEGELLDATDTSVV